MRITFSGEHRSQFHDSSSFGDALVFGSFTIKEAFTLEKFRVAETADVSFAAETAWVESTLLPGLYPTSTSSPERRARYFTIRKESGVTVTYKIDDTTYNAITPNISEVTVTGSDPRTWGDQIPGSFSVFPGDWTGTRSELLEQLTARLSNSVVDGKSDASMLPIIALDKDWEPSDELKKIGVVRASSVDPGGNISIARTDPLPPAKGIEDVLAEWPDVELYPVPDHGHDGTESPYWRWAVRKRIVSDHCFSPKEGSLEISSIKATNTFTEALAYTNDKQSEWSYADVGGMVNLGLTGPWMAVKATGHSIPEGISAQTYLRSRALTENANNSRLAIDATVNFTKAGLRGTPGMLVYIRLNNRVVQVPIGEIASHYDSEKGWSTTSPVVIETDSIDLTDPPVPPPSQDIQFVFYGDNFQIPTNNYLGTDYSWSVFVDDQPAGIFEGTSDYDSEGILVNGGSAGEHVVTIKPVDGVYTDWWATAFGFYNNENGANSLANKAKLVQVYSDPDQGHLASTTAGYANGFKAYQFIDCVNLLRAPDETIYTNTLSSRSRVSQFEGCINLQTSPKEAPYRDASDGGPDDRTRQYARCYSLTEPAEVPQPLTAMIYAERGTRQEQYVDCTGIQTAPGDPKNVTYTYIGDSFKRGQFQGCTSLTTVGDEWTPGSYVFIGDYFRVDQFAGCTSLLAAAKESIPESVQTEDTSDAGSLGKTRWLRMRQYAGCTSLVTASEEATPTNMLVLPGGFRVSMYQDCQSLSFAPAERLPEDLVTIEDGFRNSMFEGCWSLTTAADEYIPDTVEDIVGGRDRQYKDCWSLTSAGEEADAIAATGAFSRIYQYSSCFALTATPNEKMSDTVTTLPENFRNSQWYNCISLTTLGAEAMSPNITAVPDWFRIYQFDSCGPMVTIATEAPLPANIVIGDGYRGNMYSNSGLLDAGVEHAIPGDLIAGIGYRGYMFKRCYNLQLPQVEATPVGKTTFKDQFREEEYSFSTITKAAVEAELDLSDITLEEVPTYRYKEYLYAELLEAPASDVIEVSTRHPEPLTRDIEGRSFDRYLQFAGTQCTGQPGEKATYHDGIGVWNMEAGEHGVSDYVYELNTQDPNYPFTN
jgi:hypothetical protein